MTQATDLTKEQMAICATAGFTASQMQRAGCTASQMLDAGFTAPQMLDAGFTASQMLRAGCTASQMLDAGFTAPQMLDAGFTASQIDTLLEGVPELEKPYTTLLAQINAKERLFKQSTFGPEEKPADEKHICNTAMCTAGHLVSMAGKEGWGLKNRLGFSEAAALIHAKAHPDHPCQNFGSIPDAWGLAYIEMMAAVEADAVAA